MPLWSNGFKQCKLIKPHSIPFLEYLQSHKIFEHISVRNNINFFKFFII